MGDGNAANGIECIRSSTKKITDAFRNGTGHVCYTDFVFTRGITCPGENEGPVDAEHVHADVLDQKTDGEILAMCESGLSTGFGRHIYANIRVHIPDDSGLDPARSDIEKVLEGIYDGHVPEPSFDREIRSLEYRGLRLSEFKSCSC